MCKCAKGAPQQLVLGSIAESLPPALNSSIHHEMINKFTAVKARKLYL